MRNGEFARREDSYEAKLRMAFEKALQKRNDGSGAIICFMIVRLLISISLQA